MLDDLISPARLAGGLTVLTLVVVASGRVAADLVFSAAMLATILLGLLSPAQAVAGFANTGMLSIAALYVVVAGLRETGAISWVAQRFLGNPAGATSALLRLMLPSGTLSAFINNTPVVAIFIPVVQEWARRFQIPASRLLMPLSYIAILTGTCTLIGTSTNLVVAGLVESELDLPGGLGIFSITPIGLCVALAGLAYIVVGSRWLLPIRAGAVEQFENAREYAFELRVVPGGPVAGRTIAEVGLRNLRGGYLMEVQRGSRIIAAVGSDEVLQGDDILVCVGVVDALNDLRRVAGLEVAENQTHKLDLQHAHRSLVELVLSPHAPCVGRTVKQSDFRKRYRAAILSVSRAGERQLGKVGGMVLEAGDTLLVETDHAFPARHRYSRDFLLVSALQDSAPPDFGRAPVALAILVALIAASATGFVSLFEAALAAAGMMIVTRCVTAEVARNSIEYPVLVVIGCSFALGFALEQTGAARTLAALLVDLAGQHPLAVLTMVYLSTVLFTEMITNNAAAVLMFPIAVASAEAIGVSPMPYVIAIMFAASASFLTPIGYQTNLMVYGPGGYRFLDYVRFGLPLTCIVGVVTLQLIPVFWSF